MTTFPPPVPPPAPSRRWGDRATAAAHFGQLVARLAISVVGLAITYWCVRDIVVTDRLNPVPPPIGHYILIGLFGVIGLGIAGGKRTIDVLTAITKGIRAWRSQRRGETGDYPTRRGDEGSGGGRVGPE